MIERARGQRDTWECSCDNCSEQELVEEASDFSEAVATLKSLGWSIVKQLGDWVHLCKDCTRKAKDGPG